MQKNKVAPLSNLKKGREGGGVGDSPLLTAIRVSYTNDMSKDVSFALDPSGGKQILESMVAPTITTKAQAIASRARGIASSISSDPPDITVTTAVGTIKRGTRAIATIRANGSNSHENYIGHLALAKSKDAGRD